MLNLERLRVLHAVAVAGSVGGAAGALHVTTSAVSQQVARLEREVGQRLVERQGRGVRLTEAGDRLARDAGDLLVRVERVEAGLAAYRGTVDGTIAVAAFATAARGLLPGVLRDLRERHPRLEVTLAEAEPHLSIPGVRRGRPDVAVVQDWPDDPLVLPDDLDRTDLLDDVFDVALPAAHPAASRRAVTLAGLRESDWIGWSADEICHDWLVRRLHATGAEPRVRHTASEHATQVALVAAGLGVALLPRLGRDPLPDGVVVVPVRPAPVRRVCAVSRTSAAARPAVHAVLTALRTAAARPGDHEGFSVP